MKRGRGGGIQIGARVDARLRSRLEDVVAHADKELCLNLSETVEAILTAFFVANPIPTDAVKAEELVKRMRRGELMLPPAESC